MSGQFTAQQYSSDKLERVFGDRYRILEVIGTGVMSTVYSAWDLVLQRQVAVKVLSPTFEMEVEDRERFRREARIAAGLVHPNIVPVYSFDRIDGVTFLTMPYVDGESLARRLAREGTLSPTETSIILIGLADALHWVHRRHVVHRDLKPSNVLLEGGTGRPMLIDFGVATLATSDHSRSEMPKRFGTPTYMSPEQALGAVDSDGRSDLYALGVIGFQMLTGRLPFVGASPRELAAQHVALDPPPLRRLVPSTPADLARIVERCLAKEPARRWKDAERLADALRGRARSRGPIRMLRRLTARFRRLRVAHPEGGLDSGAWVQRETPSLA